MLPSFLFFSNYLRAPKDDRTSSSNVLRKTSSSPFARYKLLLSNHRARPISSYTVPLCVWIFRPSQIYPFDAQFPLVPLFSFPFPSFTLYRNRHRDIPKPTSTAHQPPLFSFPYLFPFYFFLFPLFPLFPLRNLSDFRLRLRLRLRLRPRTSTSPEYPRLFKGQWRGYWLPTDVTAQTLWRSSPSPSMKCRRACVWNREER